MGLCGHSEAGCKAAQRRAAVRRSKAYSIALYTGQAPERSDQCAWGSPIAVPWGRPGDARRPSALIPRRSKTATPSRLSLGILCHVANNSDRPNLNRPCVKCRCDKGAQHMRPFHLPSRCHFNRARQESRGSTSQALPTSNLPNHRSRLQSTRLAWGHRPTGER